jgi:two-component system NtrC family sensor kinase
LSPLDLSYRHKIPIWGGVLVIATAFAISVVLMGQTYAEMQEDLVINAATLAHAIEPEVFAAMRDRSDRRAHELVSRPLTEIHPGPGLPGEAENIVVVDRDLRVFVAAHTQLANPGVPLESLGVEFRAVADWLRTDTTNEAQVTDLSGSQRILYSLPVAEDGKRLGTLVVVLSKGSLIPRFMEMARYGLIATATLLGMLLPFNWYWGRRMAEPLVQIANRLEQIGSKWPEPIAPGLYTHKDEIGSLFHTYNRMLTQLQEKSDLERQMVHADRLAALGQLAAGVAHEINNPLGGMLVAIDTLKSQNITDSRTAKTIALLERGLGQIKETVGALLVEAKLKSRNLAPSDIEDVLVLVLPQAHEKRLHFDWHDEVKDEVALPATLVRQVLINLLLNAVQAAAQQGEVVCHVGVAGGFLRISVANDGRLLSADEMTHMFEPFSPLSEDGHGLGLWVTYQIVHQLGGEVTASRIEGRMNFVVTLPIGEGQT